MSLLLPSPCLACIIILSLFCCLKKQQQKTKQKNSVDTDQLASQKASG